MSNTSNTNKIIDCFLFYNELELLQYRLIVLDQHVDYFVIVESKQTFMGKEKPLFFEENKSRYEPFLHKIIHIIIEMPFLHPNVDISKDHQWKNESHQRNSFARGLLQLQLTDTDLIIIADVDEIPNPVTLKFLQNKTVETVLSFEQDFYYYNLNAKLKRKWYYSKILPFYVFKNLNMDAQAIRIFHGESYVPKAGWHLSYFGNPSMIQNKIQNFAHQDYNKDKYTSIDMITKRIECFTDLFGRADHEFEKISTKNNDFLPPMAETLLKEYILF
jgi:beta-1,4-mannosyl-glycoprotein beta-1,4-N-acetylglucosaminyltransferase